MSTLTVLMLGPPQVLVADASIHLSRRKSLALLAYLAGNPGVHARASLATLLSPEDDHSTALRNLRRTLSSLVRAVGHAHFAVDRRSIRLRTDELTVDLLEFQRLLAAAKEPAFTGPNAGADTTQLTSLSRAVDLVRGPFLEGLSLQDNVLFDDWQMLQAEGISRDLADALALLVDGYRAAGDPAQALVYARRWVALDPLQERANRALMGLLAESGDSPAALRHFRAVEQRLDAELGLPPDAATLQLFDAIRHGHLTVHASQGSRAQRTHVPAGAATGRPKVALPELPRPMTSFVGRQAEIARLTHLLCEEPDCRLVTLTGAGGAGKTRLALAAATAVAPGFADGVCYVGLVGVTEPASVLSAIAEQLRVPVSSQSSLKEQILAVLRHRTLLLILDNVEQLLSPTAGDSFTLLVLDLLAASSDLVLLTTSRAPLDVQPEWILPVMGLAYPGEDEAPDTARSLRQFDAVGLFADRARHVCRDFDWRQEWDAIVRICRQVDGLPLAVELAAAWAGSLSCSEIAAQIEEGPHFLTTTMHDVEPRHRSIRRVFEQSWSMLSHEEQQVLSRLAVFRGGFTRLAAEQVAGATLPILSTLVGKSLLRRDAHGRYDSQELLRQFCMDKSAANADEHHRTCARHCSYFTSLMAHRYDALLWKRPIETYRELSAETDNINAAWGWAVEHGNLTALDNAFEVYWQLLDWRGAGEEIIAVFGKAAEKLETMCGADGFEEKMRRNILGQVLIPYGQRLAHNQGKRQEGLALAEKGLALLRSGSPADWRKEFWASIRLGFILWSQTLEEARPVHQTAIELAVANSDRFCLSVAHQVVGYHACLTSSHRIAEAHIQRCLALDLGLAPNRWSLNNLALHVVVQINQGDYQGAEASIGKLVLWASILDNLFAYTNALVFRAHLARIAGDYDAAQALYAEVVRLGPETGVPEGTVYCRLKLSTILRLLGDIDGAARQVEEVAAYAGRHEVPLTTVQAERGRIAYARQHYEEAVFCLREAINAGVAWFLIDEVDTGRVDLCDALCAIQDEGAEACYRFALQRSKEENTLPIALQSLGGLARFYALHANPASALELACLVQAHPVTWHEHRVRAEQLIAELEADLPADTIAAARQRARGADAWELVAGILDGVADEDRACGARSLPDSRTLAC